MVCQQLVLAAKIKNENLNYKTNYLTTELITVL